VRVVRVEDVGFRHAVLAAVRVHRAKLLKCCFLRAGGWMVEKY